MGTNCKLTHLKIIHIRLLPLCSKNVIFNNIVSFSKSFKICYLKNLCFFFFFLGFLTVVKNDIFGTKR